MERYFVKDFSTRKDLIGEIIEEITYYQRKEKYNYHHYNNNSNSNLPFSIEDTLNKEIIIIVSDYLFNRRLNYLFKTMISDLYL